MANPFNTKIESLRIGDFDRDEMRDLYGQRAAETGQVFTKEAVERAFALTANQPWLVNVLAREVVEKLAVPLDEPIIVAHVDEAKDRLILVRRTSTRQSRACTSRASGA